MAPANTAGVQGCLQITNAMSFKIPPHRPTSILARATPTIFAVAIWSLLLLDVNTNVAVFKKQQAPLSFLPLKT